jgi:tetratricopeptide (TPR) repeat protein
MGASQSGTEATLHDTGVLLEHYAEQAEFFTRADIAQTAAEIREHYAEVEDADPGNITAALGLTVLSVATLKAHVLSELEEHWWEDEDTPFPGLDEDDRTGLALADEAVRAATRALELDPAGNLAAFSLGLALEWRGRSDEAITAYDRAVRLDPCDDVARTRIRALDGPEPPEPDPRIRTSSHARAFHLLRSTRPAGDDGDEEPEVWLLTDAAELRSEAERLLSERGPAGRHVLRLETYAPGEDVVVSDLLGATGEGADPTLRWPAVVLRGAPLPAGQPVRVGGVTYFYGLNHLYA